MGNLVNIDANNPFIHMSIFILCSSEYIPSSLFGYEGSSQKLTQYDLHELGLTSNLCGILEPNHRPIPGIRMYISPEGCVHAVPVAHSSTLSVDPRSLMKGLTIQC